MRLRPDPRGVDQLYLFEAVDLGEGSEGGEDEKWVESLVGGARKSSDHMRSESIIVRDTTAVPY